MNLQERLAQVKLLVLDHDGVLTDNHVYVNERGEEMCRYSRADGMGIQRLQRLGVEVICISTEPNPVVVKRCEKLNIACYSAEVNKLMRLRDVAYTRFIKLENAAYVGNDINDLECLKAVGISIMVNDAEMSLRDAMDFSDGARVDGPDIMSRNDMLLTRRSGGNGAVREVCDLIADAIEAECSFRANAQTYAQQKGPFDISALEQASKTFLQDYSA